MGIVLKVNEGDVVKAGDLLVGGSINPHDILRVKGEEGVEKYIIEEVQKVYNMQGVKINDRHIEVIVSQMLRKVKIDESGDTSLLPGSMVDVFEFKRANEQALAEGKKPAEGKRALLGITKASLATESFLSAASFQETTKVLTEAAIKGKKDPLLGLKENVIIGKLIPAGTGMSRYKDIEIDVTPLPQRVDEITEEIDEAIAMTESDSLEDAMPSEEDYATPLSSLAEEIVEAIEDEIQDAE